MYGIEGNFEAGIVLGLGWGLTLAKAGREIAIKFIKKKAGLENNGA